MAGLCQDDAGHLGPEQMRWEIIILSTKGGSDDCAIGLLEPF
jgi:hypothetical protein